MKKYILLVFILITSFQLLAQLEVKEGSFKKSEGFININPDIQSDDNDVLYAVVKVKTENINDKQRHELSFEGNAATFIEIEYKIGEVWVYLSSKHATYLKISHPDFSSTEFWFPCDLEPKQGYELILTNNAKETNGYGSLEITTNTITDATISINGKIMSYKTPHTFDMFPAGSHDIVVSKEKYKTTKRKITVKNDEKIKIDIIMPEAYGSLSINTIPSDVDVYLDDKFYGHTPLTNSNITVEKHKIKLLKNGYKSLDFDIIIKEDESIDIDTILIETFNIEISTSGKFDKLYIDGRYEGYSPITKQLSLGKHIIKIERGYGNIEVFEEEIVVESGGKKAFNIILDSKLNINTDRESIIYIDDKRMGEAPLSLELPKGQHHIKAIHDEKQIDTIVNLAQGEEYDLSLNIPKSRNERLLKFDIGIFGGLGTTNLKSTNSDDLYFAKGLYATVKIKKIGLKTEIMGSRTSGYHYYVSSNTHPYSQQSYKCNYNFSLTNIPILIGYETDESYWFLFGVYIGPQINICNSATYDVVDSYSQKSTTSNINLKNYAKITCNLIGEINWGYCFENFSISFLSLKFDITKPTILINDGTEKFSGNLKFSSFIMSMQFDYNF